MNRLLMRQNAQKQNKALLLFGKILFLLALFFISDRALALTCRGDYVDGGKQSIMSFPNIILSQGTSTGTIIWRSHQAYATTVCYKDVVDTMAEEVYIHLNPEGVSFVNYLEFGININGSNYALPNGTMRKVKLGVTVPGCAAGATVESCKQQTQRNFTYNFYFYIKKVGDSPGSGTYPGVDTISYFQLDGSSGLSSPDNFTLLVNGLKNISYTNCYANASFTPNSVNLGTILLKDKNPGARADKNSSEFKLTTNLICPTPLLGIDVYFDSSEKVSGSGYVLELNNGLNLKIKNTDMQAYVKFKDVTSGFLKKVRGKLSPIIMPQSFTGVRITLD